ncbi:MAG: hypothetical protein JSW39_23250 [Desulfobacterales bacterium]|nr:MAG: hypothetical protein JSW39_23250 [Desulfobacterales bacterium]
MTRRFDETTLSAFMDGELDEITLDEVDTFLKGDENAKAYIVNAVRSSAYLKAAMNRTLHERVPEHLIDTIRRPQREAERGHRLIRPLLRLAAVVLLALVGFWAGMLRDGRDETPSETTMVPVLERYGNVVDAALEYNLSGAPREWRAPQRSLVIKVTPVRTYRDRNRLYYREFRLEVMTDAARRQVNGLAYRAGDGKWITKALFFQ